MKKYILLLFFCHTYNIPQQDKSFGAITTQGRYSKQITGFVVQDFLRLWRKKVLFVDGIQTGDET